MRTLHACFLTTYVQSWLCNTRQPRILHVFDSVCNVINENGEVLSIVAPQIGRGPFHFVVDDYHNFAQIDVDTPVLSSLESIVIGNLTFLTKDAKLWNPRPNWDVIHKNRDQIVEACSLLQAAPYPFSKELISNFSPTVANAEIGKARSLAEKFAGLGGGLTPAGDDFLMGAIYAACIMHAHEIAAQLACAIVSAAVPRTTSLSAAWLRAAGRGEAGILWHDFFEALLSGDAMQLRSAEQKILAVGETSGADAIAGFQGTLAAWIKKAQTQHG